MLKRIIATTLVATALMFSGCGDGAGEDRLEAQDAIDKGNPGVAIGLLADKLANGTATNDEKALLADAYASNAGFSITDITTSFMAASDGTGDGLQNLNDSLLANVTDVNASLADLDLSIDAYLAIPVAERTDDQNFKLGLTYTVKLALLIDTTDANDPAAVTELAATAAAGFDTIATILPPEMETSVADVKSSIDANFDGTISDAEMQAYLAAN